LRVECFRLSVKIAEVILAWHKLLLWDEAWGLHTAFLTLMRGVRALGIGVRLGGLVEGQFFFVIIQEIKVLFDVEVEFKIALAVHVVIMLLNVKKLYFK
jgi:hypothetical protein